MDPPFSFGLMCGYDQMLCIAFSPSFTKFLLFKMAGIWTNKEK
jgi:hypothetical protein